MKKKCFIFLMVLLFGFSFDTEAKAEQKEEWQNELSLEQADLSLQENTKQSFPYSSMDGRYGWNGRFSGAIVDCICEPGDRVSGMHRKKLFYIFLHSVCLRGFL